MAGSSESAASAAREREGGGRFDWRGLRADLRGAVPDAAIALVITGVIFVWLYVRVENGTSATTRVMPMLADAPEFWMYWLSQAFGWSGLLWAYITVLFGLLRSGPRPPWGWLTVPRVEKLHRTTSLTTVGLMFMHAFMFFADQVRSNQQDHSWAGGILTAFADVFVPGVYASGTGRIAILLGLLAFYLAIPLGLAFYLRQRTGSRMWRALHRFIIVVYVLSVWHTLLYGTNVWYDGPFRTLVWALQMPLAGLLLLRLLTPARPSERLRLRGAGRESRPLPLTARIAGRLAVAAAVPGLLAVVITGADGGRTPGGASPGLWPEQWVIWAGLLVLTLVLVAVAYRLRPSAAVRASGPKTVGTRR
ncbi:ferric reductase-like transmembrane domain-containing protein [Streptomonospora wellingtoniae]|uniref:Ferric reductase-like transmembrane domain-containing protein n=1 Tax=Streptomonospora wellingtoniae TaxID=3075544 RepID=A0ABU2KQ44_9ACTN|nr:ferric reductase-like transmembrane domain-containing protein [Streptomonospora sp. DSM 45055]MDT0301331.1 ferric reductase-like transmembrane domain-containing protein [Streptomonospora sp. DSM 45055]